MPPPAEGTSAALDLAALDAITDAVESGAGLPEIVRAAARALDASLVLADRTGAVLAVAARSPADERSLTPDGNGVEVHELRVADEPVGQLRVRLRGEPAGLLLRLVTTLIASEVERLRAPERASQRAAAAFLHAVLAREVTDPQELLARAGELGMDLSSGVCVVVARAIPHAPGDEGWRLRVQAVAERGARAVASSSVAVPSPAAADGPAAEVVVVVPGADDGAAGRARRRSCASCRPACPATRSPSGARAWPPRPRSCTARATRRCWPRTSPRATRTGRCWPSTTRAPTGSCCPR
jgi:hypothetical protein